MKDTAHIETCTCVRLLRSSNFCDIYHRRSDGDEVERRHKNCVFLCEYNKRESMEKCWQKSNCKVPRADANADCSLLVINQAVLVGQKRLSRGLQGQKLWHWCDKINVGLESVHSELIHTTLWQIFLFAIIRSPDIIQSRGSIVSQALSLAVNDGDQRSLWYQKCHIHTMKIVSYVLWHKWDP